MMKWIAAASFAISCTACVEPLDVLVTDDAAAPPEPALRFEAPELVLEFAALEVHDVCLSEDELELYFTTGDVMRATRASVDSRWSAPVLVSELSGDTAETDPRLTASGLRMYLTSYRGGGRGDIYTSERSARDAPWGTPELVSDLSSEEQESSLTFGPGELDVYFGRRGFSSFDIYHARRASMVEPFSTPEVVAELSTPQLESSPYLRGAVLVFDTDRDGSRDLFAATRPDPSTPFDPPQAIEGVNTSGLDRDPWLSADGQRLYFTSDREGLEQLYVARRIP